MPPSLVKLYQKLYQRLIALQWRERELKGQMARLETTIQHSGETLRKQYQQKQTDLAQQKRVIQIFYDAAREYVAGSGTPVAAIASEAELQQLYTMLSGNANGLRSASQLSYKCRCALLAFQEQEAKLNHDFQAEEAKLRTASVSGKDGAHLQSQLSQVRRSYRDLCSCPEMKRLGQEIRRRTAQFSIRSNKEYAPQIPPATVDAFCMGLCMMPFPIESALHPVLKQSLGYAFSSQSQTISIPVAMTAEAPVKAGQYSDSRYLITYNEQTRDISYQLVGGLLFNILRNYTPLLGRVTCIDLETFNPEFLGEMKFFSHKESMIRFPRSEKEAQEALRKMEMEAAQEPEMGRSRRFLFVRGGLNGASKLGNRLWTLFHNARKNNIAFFFLQRESKQSGMSDSADRLSFALCIRAEGKYFYTQILGERCRFGWFPSPDIIAAESRERLAKAYAPKEIDNRYEQFSSLSKPIQYTRQRRKIEVTFGVNQRGKPSKLVFEGMDFAAFLMGSSGSGKSTMLHTILVELIRNYHPDELELWLVDLKMSEFSFYARCLPPHIKYLLIDQSPVMILDFVERLYQEMLRRKKRMSGRYQDRRDVELGEYFPALFVMIDEFSILATVIRDDDTAKNRLQEILVDGRALGIRLIFANQAFSSGAAALTSMAKDQIGLRLAMKHNKVEELRETLSIPGSCYTEEMNNAVTSILPHFVLRRVQMPDGGYTLEKSHVFYFPGGGMSAWSSRYALFQRLRKQMRPVSHYTPGDINTFVYKHPVVIDEVPAVFTKQRFLMQRKAFLSASSQTICQGDLALRFGQARSLRQNVMSLLTKERRENIFLLASASEQACAMAVIYSVACSFSCVNGSVQVWAHRRNRLFSTYQGSHFARMNPFVGTKEVKDAIHYVVTRIQSGDERPRLVVLLGMENILADLDDMEEDILAAPPRGNASMSFASSQPAAGMEAGAASDVVQQRRELGEIINALEDQADEENWPDEVLDAKIEAAKSAFFAKAGYVQPAVQIGAAAQPALEPFVERNRYDPVKEFHALLAQGSSHGCHFLAVANELQTLAHMGAKISSFNHRISFRTDSADTSFTLFDSSVAYRLRDHTAYYRSFGSTGNMDYSFLPDLHKGLSWGKWSVDKEGRVIEKDEFLAQGGGVKRLFMEAVQYGIIHQQK